MVRTALIISGPIPSPLAIAILVIIFFFENIVFKVKVNIKGD
jgi:hypothetical protein